VLARLLPRYLDDSAVVVVEGAVPETTALLEQRFDHIFFTGSTAVGKVVMAAAAEHLTPVTLELGGKSPVIVAADADLEVAARRIAWGKHLNAGQTCIAPDYVLVEAPVRDQLVDKLSASFAEFHPAGSQASADYARIIDERHLGRLRSYLAGHGGKVAHGGEVVEGEKYVEPTIVVDPDPESPVMQDEIFGPILPVMTVESVDDAITFVNERPKPLALYVFSGSNATADDVIDRTSSGGVCVNHTLLHVTPQSLPFGGVGPSGMGAYHGRSGFDVFTHFKSVLRKPTRPDPKILYPPYNALKTKIVKKAV
jgi:aldehyde dehydrogenase (NAD+)